MYLLKWIRRIIMRTLGILGLGVLFYLLAGIILGLIPQNRNLQQDNEAYSVMIYTTGIHLDICLPVKTDVMDWTEVFSPEEFAEEPLEYLAFGWGDRDFYIKTPTWDDFDLLVSARALCVPTASALHMTYYVEKPVHRSHFREVMVGREEYARLVQYLKKAVLLDSSANAVRIPCCEYQGLNDGFYESPLLYHAFLTCNDWVNRAFQKAGIPAVIWTPFDRLILRRWENE